MGVLGLLVDPVSKPAQVSLGTECVKEKESRSRVPIEALSPPATSLCSHKGQSENPSCQHSEGLFSIVMELSEVCLASCGGEGHPTGTGTSTTAKVATHF